MGMCRTCTANADVPSLRGELAEEGTCRFVFEGKEAS